MAEEAVKNEDPSNGKIVFEPEVQRPITGEELYEAMLPAESPLEDEAPITRNPTPEIQVAQMADKESYEELKIQSESNDIERLNRAVTGLFAIGGRTQDVMRTATKIINTPLPKRSLGEHSAEVVIPKHPKNIKKKLGSELSVAEGKNIVNNSVANTLGFTESYDTEMNKPNDIATEALRLVAKDKSDEEIESSSFNDFLEYINPLGGEDPEGMDIQVWEAMKSIASGDFDSEAFDKQMTSNYGEDWGGRFAAFAVKEVAIDGALLLLAASPWGVALAASLIGVRRASMAARALRYNQKGFKANARGIIARSAIVGIGGGAAQSGQNAALDRDLNFGSEVALRATGNSVFEALGLGIRMGFKNLKGRNIKEITENIAGDRSIKPLTKKELNKAFDGQQFDSSTASALVRTTLFDKADGYQKIMANAADNVLEVEKASIDVRKGLSEFLGVDELRLEEVPMDVILPLITKTRGRVEKGAADAIANQDLASKGIVGHIYSKIMGKYGTGSELSQLYLDKNSLQFRSTENNINLSDIRIMDALLKTARLAEVPRIAGRVGSDLLQTKGFSTKLADGFTKMYEDALGSTKLFKSRGSTSKFSKEEMGIINNILEVGDIDNKIYDFDIMSPRDVDPSLITPEIKEAYIKVRTIMDLNYEIRDVAAVNARGGKLGDIKTGRVFLHKGEYVEVTKKLDKGRVEVKTFDRSDMSSAGGEVNTIGRGALKEIDTIIEYRNGHIPRGYQPHNYSMLVMDQRTGAINREALFNNRVEAEQYLREREALLEEGQFVALVSNKADTGLTGFSLQRKSMNVLNAVKEEDKAVLMEALEAVGLDHNLIRHFFKDLDTAKPLKGGARGRSELGSVTTKGGRELRLKLARANKKLAKLEADFKKAPKSAAAKKAFKSQEGSVHSIIRDIKTNIPEEIQPTQASLIEYMGMVAHNAGHDNWRVVATDTFNSKYGKYLVEGSTWQNLNRKTGFKTGKEAPDPGLVSEIMGYSRFLKRQISQRTFLEKAYDNKIELMVDHMGKLAADGNRVALATRKLWDNVPMATSFGNFFRWSAAFPKLLFYPFAQVWVQGSQALSTISTAIGKDPVGLAQALSQWPRIVEIYNAKHLGTRLSRSTLASDSYKAYEDLIKSGYVSDLTTADTLFSRRTHYDPSFGRKLAEGLKAGGLIPFRTGEAINRSTAFLVVRKQFMRGIEAYESGLKAGKKIDPILGKDGEVLRLKDIGSHSFREAVVDKAAVTAFNMGKAGELEALSGAGSVLFQFKQVAFKQLSMFDSAKLTKWERLSAATGLLGFWGGTAIPLIPDVLNLLDSAYYNIIAGKNPNELRTFTDYARISSEWLADSIGDLTGADKEFLDTLMKEGVITAGTEGEINLASRIALGRIWTDTFDVQEGMEVVVSAAVLADFVSAVNQMVLRDANAVKLLNPLSWFELNAQMNMGKTFREALAMQVDPQSTIGKFVLTDTSIGATSLEVLRETGRVFSQVGSLSRAFDAANRDVWSPYTENMNDNLEDYYFTSGLNPTHVRRTSLRNTLFFLGITPGKMVEEFEENRLEFRYKAAAKDFQKRFVENSKKATSEKHLARIRFDYITELHEHRKNMVRLGLDVETVKNISRHAYELQHRTFQKRLPTERLK